MDGKQGMWKGRRGCEGGEGSEEGEKGVWRGRTGVVGKRGGGWGGGL